VHFVVPNEALGGIRSVLPHTASKFTRDPDIECAVAAAREDVHARALLDHGGDGDSIILAPVPAKTGTQRFQSLPLGPRVRGDDEFSGVEGYYDGPRPRRIA